MKKTPKRVATKKITARKRELSIGIHNSVFNPDASMVVLEDGEMRVRIGTEADATYWRKRCIAAEDMLRGTLAGVDALNELLRAKAFVTKIDPRLQ